MSDESPVEPTGQPTERSSDRGYRHRPPRRPANLPRRLEPPPERKTVDISWMVYIGIALALIFAILFIPYAIGYIVEVIG